MFNYFLKTKWIVIYILYFSHFTKIKFVNITAILFFTFFVKQLKFFFYKKRVLKSPGFKVQYFPDFLVLL